MQTEQEKGGSRSPLFLPASKPLLAAIPALGLVLYTSLEHRRLVKMNVEEEILDVVQDMVRFHGQLIRQTRQLLVLLSEIPEVRQARSQECSALFSDLVKANKELVNLTKCSWLQHI